MRPPRGKDSAGTEDALEERARHTVVATRKGEAMGFIFDLADALKGFIWND